MDLVRQQSVIQTQNDLNNLSVELLNSVLLIFKMNYVLSLVRFADWDCECFAL